jgi:hypothetical protein
VKRSLTILFLIVCLPLFAQNQTNRFTGMAITNGQQLTTVPSEGYTNIVNGLVGWWKFDEGSGTTATDSSSSGNTGTLSGSSTPSYVTGKVGPYAISFVSGNTQHVAINNSNQTAVYTVSAWIFVSAAGAAQVILDNRISNTTLANHAGFVLYLDASGFANVYSVSISLLGDVNTAGAVNLAGAWHLVAATDDGTTQCLYVDGSQVNSTITTYVGQPSDAILAWIGASYDPTYSTATIDDVRIYNRNLSAAELLDLYNFTK